MVFHVVPFIYYLYKCAFTCSNVLDLVEGYAHQSCYKDYIAKCNTYAFTVCLICSYAWSYLMVLSTCMYDKAANIKNLRSLFVCSIAGER